MQLIGLDEYEENGERKQLKWTSEQQQDWTKKNMEKRARNTTKSN